MPFTFCSAVSDALCSAGHGYTFLSQPSGQDSLVLLVDASLTVLMLGILICLVLEGIGKEGPVQLQVNSSHIFLKYSLSFLLHYYRHLDAVVVSCSPPGLGSLLSWL